MVFSQSEKRTKWAGELLSTNHGGRNWSKVCGGHTRRKTDEEKGETVGVGIIKVGGVSVRLLPPQGRTKRNRKLKTVPTEKG